MLGRSMRESSECAGEGMGRSGTSTMVAGEGDRREVDGVDRDIMPITERFGERKEVLTTATTAKENEDMEIRYHNARRISSALC